MKFGKIRSQQPKSRGRKSEGKSAGFNDSEYGRLICRLPTCGCGCKPRYDIILAAGKGIGILMQDLQNNGKGCVRQ